MKDTALSLEVKTAIDQAISAASQQFGAMLRSLAKDLATERSKSKQLAKQLANLKSILSAQSKPTPQPKTEPKLPQGFKYSPDLQTKRNEHAAQQAVLQVLEARELATYEARTLETIAARNKKIVEEMEYNKALKGSYDVAMGAIAKRKANIEANGQIIITDYSGTVAKCEIDLDTLTLFTFTRLTQPDFEYQGKMYQLTSADCSEIGAGNRYTFTKSN